MKANGAFKWKKQFSRPFKDMRLFILRRCRLLVGLIEFWDQGKLVNKYAIIQFLIPFNFGNLDKISHLNKRPLFNDIAHFS